MPIMNQVRMRLSSWLNTARRTEPSWRSAGPICLPERASQSRAVLSQLQVTMRLSSSLKAAPLTAPVTKQITYCTNQATAIYYSVSRDEGWEIACAGTIGVHRLPKRMSLP